VRRRPQREPEPDQPPVAIELGRGGVEEVEHVVGRRAGADRDLCDVDRLARG
jgi:hypothetical protein